MGIKSKSYAMDLICAVDHLEKILTEKVPLGEHEEVLKYVSDKLSKKKAVDLPRIKEITVFCVKEV